jgi:hypothetical protein
MFDATIQPISFDIVAIPDEEQPHLLLQFLMGIKVPGPQGGIALLPTGAVKVPLGKAVSLSKAEEIKEAAEGLPDPKPESDLIIAQNLAGVEEEAAERARVDSEIRKGEHATDAA